MANAKLHLQKICEVTNVKLLIQRKMQNDTCQIEYLIKDVKLRKICKLAMVSKCILHKLRTHSAGCRPYRSYDYGLELNMHFATVAN